MRNFVPRARRFAPLVSTAVALAAVAIPGHATEPAPAFTDAIVFTQLPLDAGGDRTGSDPDGTLRANFGDGARIARLSPGGRLDVLTKGFHSATDPDISFDGARMLFAGKREASGPWNLFELELADGAVRQITDDPHDARDPLYLGRLYAITADEPWEQIAFVSTRAGEWNEHGDRPATDLYSCKLDGNGIRRLTFNPSSDMDPTVLPDGRLLFSSWQRSRLDRGLPGRISLFAAQTDGLDYALFSGDEGRRVKQMPCVTADRLVVFIEGRRVGWDGAGDVASIDLRRNLHSYRQVTKHADGLFMTPSPLPDGGVLVARRPGDLQGTHGIVRLDPRTGRFDSIFDDPEYHDVQPMLVASRPRPDGRSSPVSDDRPNGVLYCLNVYESEFRERGWIEPGQKVRLRVLEGVPKGTPSASGRDAAGMAPMLPRRFLGEVEVEEDGSFSVEVPANIPIELQLIDADGLALRSCSWIWVRNRETRGCIGCHEDGERTPENRFVDALAAEPIVLAPPPEKRRTVDFRRDVMPVLDRGCAAAACHGPRGTEPRLTDAGSAYRDLLTPLDASHDSPGGAYVHAGSARTSPLVRHELGRDTAPLGDADRRVLFEWIDLGAPWGGDPGAGGPDAVEGGAK